MTEKEKHQSVQRETLRISDRQRSSQHGELFPGSVCFIHQINVITLRCDVIQLD